MAASNSSASHAASLVLTGVSMGMLHVLAGPDHLSALAVLSVGNSWRAMALGIRWGIGHSTGINLVIMDELVNMVVGMICVAIIFIALKGNLDLRKLGRYCDVLVGLFMIVLGAVGLFSGLKAYNEKVKKSDKDLLDDRMPGSVSGSGCADNGNSTADTELHPLLHLHPHPHAHLTTALPSPSASKSPSSSQFHHSHSHSQSHGHGHHHDDVDLDELMKLCSKYVPWLDLRDGSNQRILSFLIGALHGVAGPGGVLGVLPAVEMRSLQSASLYLGSFVLASTLSMGAFAALYGEVTKRIGSTQHAVEFMLRAFSSAMSILVGVIWVVLSVLGKLDELFH